MEEPQIGVVGVTFTWILSRKNSLDAGIQDESTSISIVVKVDLWLEKKKKKKKKSMKVTNIYKHEIVDTRA